jgi:hypothetical protein
MLMDKVVAHTIKRHRREKISIALPSASTARNPRESLHHRKSTESLYFLGNIQSGKSEKKLLVCQGSPVARGESGHGLLLIKGTSRREKVRKNLNPPEKSKPADHSHSRPSTYSGKIQKSKKAEKFRY